MAEAQELTTYKANCHCGAVRFTVRLPDLRAEKINSCNCSICTKNGYLLAYPQASDVVFLAGEDILKAYRFGNRDKPHRFCSECGTSILIDFSESPFESERQHTAVNVGKCTGEYGGFVC